MLEAFIVTLREGVEAALIVGITLAYLSKINRPELRKSVYAALISAFVGSLGVAALLSRTQWNQDIFEGWVMLAAAFFVVTMIIFMMMTGRKLKGEIEGKVGLLAGQNAWFGLFLFVFLMVLREGVETVLILGAVSLNSTQLLSFSRHFVGCASGDLVRGNVRQRQRPHQSAKILSGDYGDFILRGGAADCLRVARTLRKRGPTLLQARDGNHRADRE